MGLMTMLKKICPYCRRASYGASEVALWICPYCDTTLMDVAAEPVDIAECFWCGGRMAKMHDGVLVCSDCGWRYKGRESEGKEG